MSQNNNKKVAEDAPVYRSVMIAPPMPRAFSSGVVDRPKAAPLRSSKSSPVGLKKHQASMPAESATSWIPQATELPDTYLLERTNVYIKTTEVQGVADRICQALRNESIAMNVSSHDKNLLLADTNECVSFAIRLFQDQGMIVVELQRKNGCSYRFHEAARAVLRAAKGLPKPGASKRRFSLPASLPMESSQTREKALDEGLEIAMSLLKKDRLDANMLAMESIVQLTASGKDRAVVAKKVLSGDCLENMINLIEFNRLSQVVEPLDSELVEEHYAIMHRHALEVVANSLAALEERKELQSFLASLSGSVASSAFLSALVRQLEDSQAHPHDAYHATRCLRLLSKSPSAKEQIEDMGISSALASASRCRHALLEEETKELRLYIESGLCE